MKYFFLFLCLCAFQLNAQIVNIPDPLFKQHLVNHINPVIDTNGDGEIQVSEAEATLTLSVHISQFTDPTGIEAFINLEEIFGQAFQFTQIDLSNNNNLVDITLSLGGLEEIILPNNGINLERMILWGNDIQTIQFTNSYPSLTRLELYANPNYTSIDLSIFPSLEELLINNTGISAIDLGNNGNLKKLNVSETTVSTLDLNDIPNLEDLYIADCGISTLNIASLTLKRLGIGENITSINLDSQPQLEYLSSKGLGMPSLDLSSNTGLKELSLNSYPLSTIDLSNNVNLEEITSLGTDAGGLTSLDFSNNTQLTEIYINEIFLQDIDITNCAVLEKATFRGVQSLQEIDFSGNTALSELEFAGIRYVGQPNTVLSEIDLSSNAQLVSASIEGFDGLDNLVLNGANSLESLRLWDLSLLTLNFNAPTIRELLISGVSLETIDITPLSNLEYFSLRYLPTTSVIYPTSNNIKAVTFFGTNFQELDFSNFNLCRVRLWENLQLEKLILTGIDLSPMASGGNCITDPLPFFGLVPNELDTRDNPNLRFICVDDAPFAATNFSDDVEPYVTFTENCSLSGSDYNVIEGNLTFDLNTNGCASGASAVPNRLVITEAADVTLGTATNELGEYILNVGEGMYTTSCPNFVDPYEVNPSEVINNFTGLGQTETEDFCVEALQSVNDLNIAVAGYDPPNLGGIARYSLLYENAGTNALAAQISMTYDETKLNFISASIPPTSQATNTLIWDLGSVNPLISGDINVTFNVPEEPVNQAGDILNFTATIEPISGDLTPDDNTFNITDIVEADPFVPLVDGSQPDEVLIDQADEYLYFTVAFENSFPLDIQNAVVYFAANASSRMNLETIQVMASSHPVRVVLINTDFYFYLDNINLPSRAINGGGAEQGYVTFRVKPIETIAVDESVQFYASVSLDGFLLEGNTSVTYVDELSIPSPDSINNIELNLFPNPTRDIVTIQSNVAVEEVVIYTLLGRELKRYPIAPTKEFRFDINSFTAGIYLVKVKTENGSFTKRLIKM